jgi:urea transport system permease protein
MAQAHALTADEAKAIAIGESDTRIEALGKAVATADDKTAAFLQALADDAVKVAGGKPVIVRDGKGTDPVTGAAAECRPTPRTWSATTACAASSKARWRRCKLFSPDAGPAPQRGGVAAEGSRRIQAAADREGLRRREGSRPSRTSWAGARRGPAGQQRQGQAAGSRAPAGRQPQPGHQDACWSQRLQRGAEADVKAALQASLRRSTRRWPGATAGRAVLRHQPRLHPAAGGAGPGHHLRPDGRHQHGARRADDDRRLRHLRRAGRVPHLAAGAFDWYLVAAVPVSFAASALSAPSSSAASSASSTAARSRRCWPPGASA